MNITVHPDARHVPVRRGETILEAGLRAELPLQYDCRSGGCGLCVCTVLNGRFDHGPYQPATLTEAMRARGQALMCCAVPQEDLEIDVETLEPLAKHEFDATVVGMERLAPEVIRLLLQPPADLKLDFIAGQYLNVILEDGERRAFSFANPPMQRPLIDLHVRRIPGGRFTGHVFDGMKVGDTLRLEGPLGRFTLREGERPIIFLAGATGFAPVKSIIEDAFTRGITRPMRLYWGVRQVSDLYMRELAETWQREHTNFRFVPVLSDGAPGDGWEGRRGLVHQAVLEDFPDMRGQELYACGSTMMVETAVPEFLSHGLEEGACFSDAFVLNTPKPAEPAALA
ncbi:MAG: 2Fe-2S iron-sulfur cluster binding domain-containing protein [Proteobacteria bacterium]|nr:2Fe-2S iron-sulfur cluster binding domain-containing protein [Pseudomonadota bacterium]